MRLVYVIDKKNKKEMTREDGTKTLIPSTALYLEYDINNRTERVLLNKYTKWSSYKLIAEKEVIEEE